MSDVNSFIIIVGCSLYSPKIMNRKRQPKKKNKLTSPKFWRHPYGIKHIKLLRVPALPAARALLWTSAPTRQVVFCQAAGPSAHSGRVAAWPRGAFRCHRGNDSQVLLWGPVPGGGKRLVGMVIPVVCVLFCCFFWHVALVLQVGQSSPSSPSRGTNPQWRMSSPWAQSLRVLES